MTLYLSVDSPIDITWTKSGTFACVCIFSDDRITMFVSYKTPLIAIMVVKCSSMQYCCVVAIKNLTNYRLHRNCTECLLVGLS